MMEWFDGRALFALIWIVIALLITWVMYVGSEEEKKRNQEEKRLRLSNKKGSPCPACGGSGLDESD